MKPKLVIYVNNPRAPKPNKPLIPGTCAVLINKKGEIFLHKRSDSELWSLPGGQMKIGESISQCCMRELKEETGLKVKISRLIGIYTSPKIIFKFPNGDIFQSFVVAFLCKTEKDKVSLNRESKGYKWSNLQEIQKLKTLPLVKKIIHDAFRKSTATFD